MRVVAAGAAVHEDPRPGDNAARYEATLVRPLAPAIPWRDATAWGAVALLLALLAWHNRDGLPDGVRHAFMDEAAIRQEQRQRLGADLAASQFMVNALGAAIDQERAQCDAETSVLHSREGPACVGLPAIVANFNASRSRYVHDADEAQRRLAALPRE